MSKGQGLSFKLKLKKSSKVVKIPNITNSQYIILQAFENDVELHSSLLIDLLYEKLPAHLRPSNMPNGLFYVIKGLNKKLAALGYDVQIVGHNQGSKGKFYWVEKNG